MLPGQHALLRLRVPQNSGLCRGKGSVRQQSLLHLNLHVTPARHPGLTPAFHPCTTGTPGENRTFKPRHPELAPSRHSPVQCLHPVTRHQRQDTYTSHSGLLDDKPRSLCLPSPRSCSCGHALELPSLRVSLPVTTPTKATRSIFSTLSSVSLCSLVMVPPPSHSPPDPGQVCLALAHHTTPQEPHFGLNEMLPHFCHCLQLPGPLPPAIHMAFHTLINDSEEIVPCPPHEPCVSAGVLLQGPPCPYPHCLSPDNANICLRGNQAAHSGDLHSWPCVCSLHSHCHVENLLCREASATPLLAHSSLPPSSRNTLEHRGPQRAQREASMIGTCRHGLPEL